MNSKITATKGLRYTIGDKPTVYEIGEPAHRDRVLIHYNDCIGFLPLPVIQARLDDGTYKVVKQ